MNNIMKKEDVEYQIKVDMVKKWQREIIENMEHNRKKNRIKRKIKNLYNKIKGIFNNEK